MPIYPYNSEIKKASGDMNNVNFGLWYNKFIPVADASSKKPYKACDKNGIPDNAAEFYAEKFSRINKADIQRLLTDKHINQADFCSSVETGYEKVVFKAKLVTPLITGIGESHPHEVSMVFDHNMGIPYIPASGIKGIVRFAHNLSLIDNIPDGKLISEKNGKSCEPYFDDEYDGEDWKTYVKELFGTQKNRGSIIFMDAYPENVPELNVDIMNPHYGEYYSDDSGPKPPADYLSPKPIKFLTVASGTTFVFRALVDKKITELTEKVKSALRNAMCEEGIGAKTAIGHGLFDNPIEEESQQIIEHVNNRKRQLQQKEKEKNEKAEAERKANLSEDEKIMEEIELLKIGSNEIPAFIKMCLEKDLKKATYLKLKEKLLEIDKWKPSGSKQRKVKMKNRNSIIEAKINS